MASLPFPKQTDEQIEDALNKQRMNEMTFWRVSPFMRRTAPLAKQAEPGARRDDRLIKTDAERRELRDVLLAAIKQFPKTKAKSRIKEAAELMLNGHTGMDLAAKMGVTKQRASQYEAKVLAAFRSLRERAESTNTWDNIDAFYTQK